MNISSTSSSSAMTGTSANRPLGGAIHTLHSPDGQGTAVVKGTYDIVMAQNWGRVLFATHPTTQVWLTLQANLAHRHLPPDKQIPDQAPVIVHVDMKRGTAKIHGNGLELTTMDFVKNNALEASLGRNASFRDFIRAYTITQPQVDLPVKDLQSSTDEKLLLRQFSAIPSAITYTDEDGTSSELHLPPYMQQLTSAGLQDLQPGHRSLAIRVLSNKNGVLRYENTVSEEGRNLKCLRYQLPYWSGWDARAIVDLKVDKQPRVVSAIITLPGNNGGRLHLRFMNAPDGMNKPESTRTDPARHVRTRLAGFLDVPSVKAAPFAEQRKEIVRELVLKNGYWKQDNVDGEVEARLMEAPNIDEIAMHLQAYEHTFKKSLACEPRTMNVEGNALTPEQIDRIKCDFEPVKGRKILVEGFGIQRLVRANEDGTGLEVLTRTDKTTGAKTWESFDIVDFVDRGIAKAVKAGEPYSVAYLLNKPGSDVNAADNDNVSLTEESRQAEGEFAFRQSRVIRRMVYGKKEISMWKAGRYLISVQTCNKFGTCFKKYKDDSEEFMKLVKANNIAAVTTDLISRLGNPSDVYECQTGRGLRFAVELHPITVKQGAQSGHFILHLAQRDNVVLALRLKEALDADTPEILHSMSRHLGSQNGVLQAVVDNNGLPPREILSTDDRYRIDYKAVVFHSGTAYERPVILQRVSSMYFAIPPSNQEHLTRFVRDVWGRESGVYANDLIDAALATNATEVASTVDYKLMKYEFEFGDDSKDAIALSCEMYLMIISHRDERKIGMNAYVYKKGEAPSKKAIVDMIDRTTKYRVGGRTAFEQKQYYDRSPVPGITGNTTMVTIGQFWFKRNMKNFMKGLPDLLERSGFRLQCPEGFFRKAIEQCITPRRSYLQGEAALDAYKFEVGGKEFHVLLGHHTKYVTNLIPYAHIIAGSALPTHAQQKSAFNAIESTQEFVNIMQFNHASPLPEKLAMRELNDHCPFNIVLDDRNYVFEPIGDLVVPYVLTSDFYKRYSRSYMQFNVQREKTLVNEAILACVKELGSKPRRFVKTVILNATPSTDAASLAAQCKTEHFAILFYDTEVCGRKFKMALLTPEPYLTNMHVTHELRLADEADPEEMASFLLTTVPERRLPELRAVIEMKKRGEDLSEKIRIPDNVTQKLARLAAQGIVSDEPESDMAMPDDAEKTEEQEAVEQEAGEPVSLADTLTTYATENDFLDAINASEDIDDEAIRSVTRSELSQLDLSHGLVKGREHKQLMALGYKWSETVRYVPMPGPENQAREGRHAQFKNPVPEIDERLRTTLLRTDPDNQVRRARARAAGREIVEAGNKLLKPVGIALKGGLNPFEPMVRLNGHFPTYSALVSWAKSQSDGGKTAALHMLRWMEGKNSLSDLPMPLRLLAAITHFSEVGRGYIASLPSLRNHMLVIISATTKKDTAALWRNFASAYPPALTWKEDEALPYEGNESDAASVMSIDSESNIAEAMQELSLLNVDGDVDMNDAQAITGLMPSWSLTDSLRADLNMRYGEERVGNALAEWAAGRVEMLPARDDNDTLLDGKAICILQAEPDALTRTVLHIAHDGKNILDIDFVDEDIDFGEEVIELMDEMQID